MKNKNKHFDLVQGRQILNECIKTKYVSTKKTQKLACYDFT